VKKLTVVSSNGIVLRKVTELQAETLLEVIRLFDKNNKRKAKKLISEIVEDLNEELEDVDDEDEEESILEEIEAYEWALEKYEDGYEVKSTSASHGRIVNDVILTTKNVFSAIADVLSESRTTTSRRSDAAEVKRLKKNYENLKKDFIALVEEQETKSKRKKKKSRLDSLLDRI